MISPHTHAALDGLSAAALALAPKAKASAGAIARLEPELLVTGHGRPMAGPEMLAALHGLADRFDEVPVPHAGRYARHPARPESGAYR